MRGGKVSSGRTGVRHGLRVGAALFVAAVTSGCILQKDLPDPALDVPSVYKEARDRGGERPPALDWWRGFASRELTTLMEEAQTVNLDIAAATSRILQADAQARITGAALLPFVSADVNASRARSSGRSSGGGLTTGREFSTYSASLSASYEIDFWGKNRDAVLSAEELVKATKFDRDVVALTTLAAVANAYFQVLTAQDRIRLATSNIASAQRIYDAIKQRLDVGTGTDLDLAQQESVLASQKASVPPLRQTLTQNVNALATLVSRPPESINVAGGSLRRLALPRVTPGLPSELLIQRPDIRRAEASLAATTADVGSARAQFFPSIQLTGQGGYQSAALASLFTPQAAFFNLAAGATQPIFDAARIQSNFDLQKARQDEALQTYRKTVVSAFADVDNALVALRQTSERLRLQTAVVSASRRAFDLAEQRLRAGTTDIITVLNTQLTLFQAEDSLAQIRLSRFQAIVSLYQALGGGWTREAVRTVNAL
jgi:NodT family efflux transporter outer membrane factor (OMF) lipoprotein